MTVVSVCFLNHSRIGCIFYIAIYKSSLGALRVTPSVRECCPFFMHVMCDVLAKRHSDNGMVEYARFGTVRLLSLVWQALDLDYLKSIIKEKL